MPTWIEKTHFFRNIFSTPRARQIPKSPLRLWSKYSGSIGCASPWTKRAHWLFSSWSANNANSTTTTTWLRIAPYSKTGQRGKNRWNTPVGKVPSLGVTFISNCSMQIASIGMWLIFCLSGWRTCYHLGSWRVKTKKFWTKRFSNLLNSTGLKCSPGSRFSIDSILTRFRGLNLAQKMKMPATLPTKISTCFGKFWSGYLKMFSFPCWDAFSTALKSRKNTLESSTIVKRSGPWSWQCQLRICRKKLWSQCKK